MTPIEALIEARLGLSPRAAGPGVIDRAIGRRMAARGLGDRSMYAAYAAAHAGEWETLLEELVVPETWFFRIPEAFAELVRLAEARRKRRPDAPLRIVSLPCATGEEPYSIVMALFQGGMPPESFAVDAIDVSARALCRAQAGIFGEAAFRGVAHPVRDQFFDQMATGYGIHSAVRKRVRFLRGNLLDPCLLADAPPYDVVFCRNLVIYLSERARGRAAAAVDRLLAADGLLFVGHAEADIFREFGFVRTPAPRAFAFRRTGIPESPATPGVPERPAEAVPPLRGEPPAEAEPAPFRPVPVSAPPAPAGNSPSTEARPAGALSSGDLSEDRNLAEADDLEAAGRLADGGALAEALERCRDHLARQPADPRAHFLAGMIHQSRGEEAAAEAHFERTVYLDPTHHEALCQLALGADRRGERPRADRFRARARRVREREDAQ
ncbi:MAG: CheR family methyltransferase [Desulfococcaceae bacterium]